MIRNNMGFPFASNQVGTFQPQFHGGNETPTPQYPYQIAPPPVAFYQPQPLPMEYNHPNHQEAIYNHSTNVQQGLHGYPVNLNHIPDVISTRPPASRETSAFGSGRTGLKRKASDAGFESPLPTKLKIDEAKMSTCMGHLNLEPSANNALDVSEPETQMPWFSVEDENQMSNEKTPTRNLIDLLAGGATLEMKDEFKVDFRPKELLPKSVIDEIVKPCLQLVLWKAPADNVLGRVTGKSADESDSEDETTSAPVPDILMRGGIHLASDLLHIEDVDMDP